MDKLATINFHKNDNLIKFYEDTHIYIINGKYQLDSVTKIVKNNFSKFDSDLVINRMMASSNWINSKYYGKTRQEIKAMWSKAGCESRELGTRLHNSIECYYNDVEVNDDSKEYSYFLNFVNDYPLLKPYRTEWRVWDLGMKIAGSIDMVFENLDGTLSLYDWKRCKSIDVENTYNKFSTSVYLSHIPDTNFWQYSLQLNLYKRILEKNYNKIVKDMYLVCFHPNNLNYELYKVPELTKELNIMYNSGIDYFGQY